MGMVEISKAELSGAIYNGLNRYYVRSQVAGFGEYFRDYIDAVRKGYIVVDALKLPIMQYVKALVVRELKMARLPVWWNVIKGNEIMVDVDELDIFEVAEVSYLGRKFEGKILNIGEVDAYLRVYLDSFKTDKELWTDAEAIENFARVFPYAYYGGLYDEGRAKEFRDFMFNKAKEVEVPDWVLFVLSGGERQYLRGKFVKLWEKEYWFVLF